MGERRVSLIVGSGCGTPWVHQKFVIQLSADNDWIPRKPLRFPPVGGGAPAVSLDDVVLALGSALRRNAARRGSPVQNVSGPHNAPGAPPGLDKDNRDKEGKRKDPKAKNLPEQQREIVFFARDEVNIGLTPDGGNTTQLTVKIKVDPGPGVFRIKKLRNRDVLAAFKGEDIPGRRGKKKLKPGNVAGGGWPYYPEYVPHDTIPFGPGEGTDGWIEIFSSRSGPAGTAVAALQSISGEGWGEHDFGPEYLTFGGGGLADLQGEHSQAEVYFADGFYYPKDTALIRSGQDISLTSVGIIDADSPTQLDFRQLEPVEPQQRPIATNELIPTEPESIQVGPPNAAPHVDEISGHDSPVATGDDVELQAANAVRPPMDSPPGSTPDVAQPPGPRSIIPNGAIRPGGRSASD